MKWRVLALRHAKHVPWLLPALWLLAFLGIRLGWWRVGSSMVPLVMLTCAIGLAVPVWATWQRERWIREAPLPQFLKRKLRQTYPHLSGKDADLVERGLRQFFLACHRSRRQFVAMPSKVVDVLWHEFILHTQAYQRWCDIALGHFLHHTPAEVLGPRSDRNDGLRRAWFWACKEESINPRKPSRLPLLFALDAKCGIEGGFQYVPDCKDIGRKSDANGDGSGSYCATDFSDGSSSGDSDGFGGMDSSDSSHSSGGSDGESGSGGDGCGSGCGGGGD
ncbi:hypothetical protein [Rhodoferax sp. GW822-FHT02A01]|uniref:glycine-rich domain-containing protein n=1 Tax=Rhodoferax sp. GW822-FHT02A01 TaxID=3141537 RepID=UPI00315D8EED